MLFFRVEILKHKNLFQEFSKIYGINFFCIKKLKKKFGLNSFISLSFSKLKKDDIKNIELFFSENFIILDNLREDCYKRVQLFKKLRTNRGLRHKAGLPVRGQRTHTNANTKKLFKSVKKNNEQQEQNEKD